MQNKLTLLDCFTVKTKISNIFFSNEYVICESRTHVLVYCCQSKHQKGKFPKRDEYCIIVKHPPYIFAVLTGQFIEYYNESIVCLISEAISKPIPMMVLETKGFMLEEEEQIHFDSMYDARRQTSLVLPSTVSVVRCKTSKMEPRCLVSFNKGYYIGGYNRSRRPGQHRTHKRYILYYPRLLSTEKNVWSKSIELDPNQQYPTSLLMIQHPYLMAYCQPILYVLSVEGSLLVKVSTLLSEMCLLEGRYAVNALNGVGISQGRVFTFDVESSPVFGVQIVQHKVEATQVCREKGGCVLVGGKQGVVDFVPGSGKVEHILGKQEVVCMDCSIENVLTIGSKKGDKEYRVEMYQL